MWGSVLLFVGVAVFGANCYGLPKPVPHNPYDSYHRQPPKSLGPALWNDLRVTFSTKGQQGGYTQLPRTARDAQAKGYTTPPEESVPHGNVGVMCYDKDPSVCLLFDKFGNIAGIEIGVRKSDVINKGYPFEKHPSFALRRRFGYDVFVTTLYFVDQNVLAKGGRSGIDAHATGTGLWLKNGPQGKSLFEIPRLERDMAKTYFKRQGCLPGMGLHYFYKMSPALRCEDFEPIFGLYEGGHLKGFGFIIYGTATPFKKTWFESIPNSALGQVVPDAPQCLADWANAKGLISLHVFFGEKPWDIACGH